MSGRDHSSCCTEALVDARRHTGAALLRETRDAEAVKERTDWAAMAVMFFFICCQLVRDALSFVRRFF